MDESPRPFVMKGARPTPVVEGSKIRITSATEAFGSAD
jgi:hypothetical protein